MIEKLSTGAALWVSFAAGVVVTAMIFTPLAFSLWGDAICPKGGF